MTVIFLLPTIVPVALDTMNYAVVFLAFILFVATVWWFLHGRRTYTGPIMQAEIRARDGEVVPGAVMEKEMIDRRDGEKVGRGSDSN